METCLVNEGAGAFAFVWIVLILTFITLIVVYSQP